MAHVRNGFGAVRPYIHGEVGSADFLSKVFNASILEKHDFGPNKFHAELKIGDSALILEEGDLPEDYKHWSSSVYVYVADVDQVYKKALSLGARGKQAPVDKPYSERQACFEDISGNTWWIATYLA